MLFQDQISIIRSGVEYWNNWRSENPEIEINLKGADLSSLDLAGINLSKAKLSEANLSNTKLVGANLSDSTLFKANFTQSDLSNSKLIKAFISEANLQNAILKQTDLSNSYLSAANLRGSNLFKANLTGAKLNLANLTLADLIETILFKADLCHADLSYSDIRRADLSETKLKRANLTQAFLNGVDLCGSELSNAKLINTNLTNVNLEYTDLRSVNFSGAKIVDSNFSDSYMNNSIFENTTIGNISFQNVYGLDSVQHKYPSTIGTDTLLRSQGIIPLEFLRGCGLQDWEIEHSKLYREGLSAAQINDIIYKTFEFRSHQPLVFYSTFISYSHKDKEFARNLHDKLQESGIRCWLDEKQLLPGDDIYEEVDKGIRFWDKILLCCSESSLTSWWVDNEISTAFSKEQDLFKKRGRKIKSLIPLNLDGYMFSEKWTSGKKIQVKERLAADFTDMNRFEEEFDKLKRALLVDDLGKEKPPKSLL